MKKIAIIILFITFTFVCKSQVQITLYAPSGFGKCVDVYDASISFTVTGATPPFKCIITNSAGCLPITPSLTAIQPSFTFTGIPGCTSMYTLSVYDLSNNLLIAQIFAFGVYSQVPLSAYAYSINPASCPTCCDGQAYLGTNGGSFQGPAPANFYIDNIYMAYNFFPCTGICAGTHTLCAQDHLGCIKCTTITIPFSNPNGIIKNNLLNNINIYPNPTTGILNLETDNFSFSENAEIKITNLLGQIIRACKLENKINISSLKNGIYFLQVFNNGKLFAVEKIVKE